VGGVDGTAPRVVVASRGGDALNEPSTSTHPCERTGDELVVGSVTLSLPSPSPSPSPLPASSPPASPVAASRWASPPAPAESRSALSGDGVVSGADSRGSESTACGGAGRGDTPGPSSATEARACSKADNAFCSCMSPVVAVAVVVVVSVSGGNNARTCFAPPLVAAWCAATPAAGGASRDAGVTLPW